MTTSAPADPSLIFPAKTPGETIQVRFPFLDLIQWGETLITASFTAVVYSGVDASPSDILQSTMPDTVKSTILLQVTAGLVGVIYLITCKVIGSSGNTYQRAGLLVIVSDDVI